LFEGAHEALLIDVFCVGADTAAEEVHVALALGFDDLDEASHDVSFLRLHG
jgi:hypothetical protein